VPVQIAASGGNLTIRRGPGVAYNPVGLLRSGESALVVGRNEAGDWAYVERPGEPGKYGWIYNGNFASLEGDLVSQRVVRSEPGQPAHHRNCTSHPMRVLPTDFILAERFAEPSNAQQVFQGVMRPTTRTRKGIRWSCKQRSGRGRPSTS
jgi:hypothetical protein